MSITRVIGVEWRNRRHDRRVSLPPIEIELGCETFPTADWSLGGFRIESCRIDPATTRIFPGAVINVVIVVIAGEEVHRHPAEVEIIRVDIGGGRWAARFTRLPPDAVALLEALQTGRLRRRRKPQPGRAGR